MQTRRAPRYWIRWLNTAGAALERRHCITPGLCPERLQARAQRRTGLRDWGDTSFLPGLERLTEALREQAGLSQTGRIVAYYNLLDQLCLRLRLIDYRAARAEVAAQRIEKPLFILGLPRTGTTILHELIAQDPAFRAPLTWEVTRPLPPPRAETRERDPRAHRIDRVLPVLEQLAPGFRAIHAISARLPQECVYLLASAFLSEQYGYMYDIPAYRAWLFEQDMAAAYRWHARFLQHLQVDSPPARWVLKTPAHLASLQPLLAQYPDASIVWTHRRPLDAITSFSSLTCTLRSGFSDRIDPLATGAQEIAHFARVVRRGLSDRRALDTGQFIDVGFSAICADPIAVVRGIYQRIGLTLDPEAARRMQAYLLRRPRHLYGEHHYRADEFGLDSTRERQLYPEYLSTCADYLD